MISTARAALAAIFLLLLTPSVAFAAAPPTPAEELQIAREAAEYRKALAMANHIEFHRAVDWVAAVEQAEYDEAQRRRVARAVEETDDDGDRDRTAPRYRPSAPGYVEGSGACGGNLPPCSVMQRESGGNIRAQNPNSTASGKWQFLDSTWRSVTGLPGSAADYDEATQDAAAAELWAGGAGCRNWSETDGCG